MRLPLLALNFRDSDLSSLWALFPDDDDDEYSPPSPVGFFLGSLSRSGSCQSKESLYRSYCIENSVAPQWSLFFLHIIDVLAEDQATEDYNLLLEALSTNGGCNEFQSHLSTHRPQNFRLV